MSKGLIAAIVVILIISVVGCGKYNGLVEKDEAVNQSWGNLQSAYQRRSDLIPSLVEAVKGAANFEKSTLTEVIEARSKATQTTIDTKSLTPENINQFMNAQGALSNSLSRLLVTVERYPELKANQNFRDFQVQLEGTENRIRVDRDKFNGVVRDYNQEIRTFPNNIFAGVFGFSKKDYFAAQQGAEKAPTFKF